ncbi:hypothetical protein M9Y10_038306 [Tritrichomonas musculus]|uniref:Uncharacterized protein n=1 Tax=Tritrichomonas musculus TaxID=1915356 RepID=A0ABR2K8X1_9EUKA
MLYKILSNPTISELYPNIEANEIDTSFMSNNFEENYQNLKELGQNHITNDPHIIKDCLKRMEDEIDEMQIYAIFSFCDLLNKSPYQLISNMNPNHLLILLHFALNDCTQYFVLESLCYIIQCIQNSPAFIQALIDFDFFYHLCEIIKKQKEDIVVNLCFSIGLYSLKLGDEILNIMITSELFELANSYLTKEERTNITIARLFGNAFSIKNDYFIDNLSHNHMEKLAFLAFYGDFLPVNEYGLDGIFNLFKNYPDKVILFSSNNYIFVLSKKMLDKEQNIRLLSAKILLQCINETNFPPEKFYEYNVIESLLRTFQWCDEKLCLYCIDVIKSLIYRSNEQIIQQIVAEIVKTDLFTNVEPLTFIVKEGLTTVFGELIKRLNSIQIEILMNEKILKFLFDFISIGQTDVVNLISSIFINTFDRNSNEQFKKQIMILFDTLDILEILENAIIDEDSNNHEIGHIKVLISRLQEYFKSC